MRRVFLHRAEVPGLLRGVLAGDATSLRRILGGRYGGRYGVLLLAVAALPAVAPGSLARGFAVHVLLSAAGLLAARGAGLRALEYQRLVPWALAVPLLLTAPLRLLGAEALGPVLALCAGHALLWRGLRRGLG